MYNSDLLIAQLQRRSRIMLASTLGGLAAIAIGMGIFMFNALTDITPPSPEIGEKATTALPAPITSNSDSGTTTIMTPADALPDDPKRPTVSYQDKQKFLSAAQNFNSNIRAKVTNFPRLAGSRAYLDLMTKLEADLVSLSSQSRFTDASHTLNNAKKTIQDWMAAELDQFQQLIGEADTAWQNKQLATLTGIVAQAGAIYSADPAPLNHYHALASDWPAVSTRLQRANTAFVENKPAEEQKALRGVAQLTHDISGLDDRLAAVGQRLHQQRVDHLLGLIAQAITTGDVDTARTNLTQLGSIDPKTPEIPKLNADLKQLEERIAFRTAMQAMDQFAADDKWDDAYKVASQYREQFQTYQRFQQRADFVTRVHRLIASTSNILNAPDKLIRSVTQKTATMLIADSKTVLSLSSTLARLIDELEEMLNSYLTPLDIVVVSDTHTFVEVKSVGQVGQTAQKTIQLLPGDYVFVGKRKGFVTTQVPVALRPGDAGIKILVIANEQI